MPHVEHNADGTYHGTAHDHYSSASRAAPVQKTPRKSAKSPAPPTAVAPTPTRRRAATPRGRGAAAAAALAAVAPVPVPSLLATGVAVSSSLSSIGAQRTKTYLSITAAVLVVILAIVWARVGGLGGGIERGREREMDHTVISIQPSPEMTPSPLALTPTPTPTLLEEPVLVATPSATPLATPEPSVEPVPISVPVPVPVVSLATPISLPIIDTYGPFVPVLASAGLYACRGGANIDGVSALVTAWRALPRGSRLPAGTLCARNESISLFTTDSSSSSLNVKPLWTVLYRTELATGSKWLDLIRDAFHSGVPSNSSPLQEAGAVVCVLAKQGRFSASQRALSAANIPTTEGPGAAGNAIIKACADADSAAILAKMMILE